MRIITGSAKGRKLLSPKGSDIRPTLDWVKEALFNILGSAVAGSNFLDLFSGTGNIGLEALSRGASVTMVEKDSAALALLKTNIEKCGFANNYQVLRSDVIHYIRLMKKYPPAPPYDIIYADPPYESELASQILAELPSDALSPEGLLIIEHRTQKREPPLDSPLWQKERDAVYGKVTLSFFRPMAE